MRVPKGQPVRATVEVRDLDGALVTPDTIVFDFLGPLGTTTVGPTPVLDSAGKYHVDLSTDLDLIGHYTLRWVTTGPGAGVKVDSLDVTDPFAAELLSLADGKTYLNIAATNTAHDVEVAGFIQALTPTVEFWTGPVEPRTVRRSVVGGYQLVLPVVPVVELVSLGSYGVATDVALLDVDPETGIVRWLDGYSRFFRGQIEVVYVAGRRDVPAAYSHAAKVILAHLWETQRGRGSNTVASRQATAETTFVPGLGYSVPNRAIELLKPLSARTGLS